uniref:Uncharacterized protein n=1 Tax=Favella ehrenbergii TaxID=182087 RepID=A0A7S3I5V6_9SPIT|mmetsp:Transcript_36362/g.44392  ORF Transcript_36362/g.44392 Transcript_36362/m.44392 type:complete len:140 (+) Transcript_36362:314-733(+)
MRSRGYFLTGLTLLGSYWFMKTLRRSYRELQVVRDICLKPDGKTLDVTCHFPFSLKKISVPIKNLNFIREDELARKLRLEPTLVDMRCTPFVYQGVNYNVFIEGSVYDKEVFRAVSDGKEIDTSDSVNPHTLQSLIVDV